MTSVTSSTPLPTPLSTFLHSFYHASDLSPHTSPLSHRTYTDHFLPSATLIMGPATFPGPSAIQGWREKGWTGIVKREHHVKGVFHAGEGEIMLYGDVRYEKETGEASVVDWAGRMGLEMVGEEWKIRFYQVYLVSSLRWLQCAVLVLTSSLTLIDQDHPGPANYASVVIVATTAMI